MLQELWGFSCDNIYHFDAVISMQDSWRDLAQLGALPWHTGAWKQNEGMGLCLPVPTGLKTESMPGGWVGKQGLGRVS